MLNRRLLGMVTSAGIWIGLVYDETSATYYWISDRSESTYFDWHTESVTPEPHSPGGSRIHVVMSPDNDYQFQIADDSDVSDVLCEELDAIAETTLPSSAGPFTTSSAGKSGAQESSDNGSETTWIIVGSSVAGGVVLVISAVAVYYCCLKKPLAGVKKRRSDEENEGGNAGQGGGGGGGGTVGHYDI